MLQKYGVPKSVPGVFTGFFILYLLFASSLAAEAFRAGEVLRYKIKWGAVTAGYAVMSVSGPRDFRGRQCLVFRSQARSTGALGALYPVNDQITSYWDPIKKRTHFFVKKLSENSYRRTYRALFYHHNNKVIWRENLKKTGRETWDKSRGVSKNLPANIQDMLSAIYHTRSHKKKGTPGQSFFVPVYDDGKVNQMKMSILKRVRLRMIINGKITWFNALLVKPFIKTSGLFQKKGEVLIWISDDNRRWPLQITSKIPWIGTVKVRLYQTRGESPLEY